MKSEFKDYDYKDDLCRNKVEYDFLVHSEDNDNIDVVCNSKIIKNWIYADSKNNVILAQDDNGYNLISGHVSFREKNRACQLGITTEMFLELVGIHREAIKEIQFSGVRINDKYDPHEIIFFRLNADWMPSLKEGEESSMMTPDEINNLFLLNSNKNHLVNSFDL